MSYNPVTDFLALSRLASDGLHTERMPGLDYVVAAMARAGLFSLSIGQSPPTVNQSTTVWIKPSLPSWVAEGTVYLWNPGTRQYELATAALWNVLLSASSVFQTMNAPAVAVNSATTLLAIQRTAPSATGLTLPSVASRTGKLQIVDWSTGVVNHSITITPAGAETIMQRAAWQLLSTADQLAGITLYPSRDLNGWIITP